jgi:methyl-accepting chemotaxis protein
MPSIFSRLSVAARMSMLVGVCLLALVTISAGINVYSKMAMNRHLADDKLHVALEVFSDSLASDVPGLQSPTGQSGGEVHLVKSGDRVVIPTTMIDRLSDLTETRLTYFERDPATGDFGRLATTVVDDDGRRQVGTSLATDSPAHIALSEGDDHLGDVVIGGLPYRAIYEPVRDPAGNVVGAVAGLVKTESLNTTIMTFAFNLLLPTLILLAVGLVGTYLTIRRELRPLGIIAASLGRLARRDYGTEIPKTSQRNEIGALTDACIALRADLLEAARTAENAAAQEAEREALRKDLTRVVEELRAGLIRLADGDLSTQISSTAEHPFPADYDTLRQSYNSVIDRVSEVIEQVNTIARGVRDSSAEIAEASRELSGRAETQAATLEQSAAALTELTQSVASTAERAGMAQEASFGNRTGAERGAEIVRDAVTAMQGIERGSEQITRIIGVIDDIAFQTNLLALNAGVEAARAGEAGRGFAVVASEVRLLAQRASESAREIKALISDSTQQVDQGSALVRKAGDSLAEILGRANEAASLVADIALAAAEQARGLAEVNSGVNQLDTVTQQNSAVAEETSAAAATLQSRSEELITALSGFRTRPTGTIGIISARRGRAESPEPAVEAKVVDWAPAVAASASRPRANPAKANGTWAEF